MPDAKDLETPLEVGSFAWNWMEPPLGQVCSHPPLGQCCSCWWVDDAVGDGSYNVICIRRASSCCACNMPVLRCRILVRCCGSQSLSLCMHAFLSELFVPPPPPPSSSSYSSLLSYSMVCYAGIRPLTSYIKSRRADRLVKQYPQYSSSVLISFSEGDPMHGPPITRGGSI